VGFEKPFLVVSAGLLKELSEDELLAVLGHELAHIKAGHMVYRTVLWLLTNLSLTLAQAALGLSDDRAACLLASLEIEAGSVDNHRLEHHYQAIGGQSYETLAVKLIIGSALELPFPHDVPLATLAILESN
jgi:hypothetical protein